MLISALSFGTARKSDDLPLSLAHRRVSTDIKSQDKEQLALCCCRYWYYISVTNVFYTSIKCISTCSWQGVHFKGLQRVKLVPIGERLFLAWYESP